MRLTISHPNAKNTGVSAEFDVCKPYRGPLWSCDEGILLVSLYRQKTAADNDGHEATFDLDTPIVVTFKPIEIAEILMVLGGSVPLLMHNGREGIFHNDPDSTTSVTLHRSEAPDKPGFLLGVGHTPKADPNERRYITLYIAPAEAFMLRTALMAKMGEICFG